MTPDTEPASSSAASPEKPRFSFLLATCFGLGYLPKAPGTWGSLAGALLTWLIVKLSVVRYMPSAIDRASSTDFIFTHDGYVAIYWDFPAFCCLLIAALGVWASSRVASYAQKKDPQFVVIDEVSGQILALFLGALTPAFAIRSFAATFYTPWGALWFKTHWSVFLCGLALFRLFDIWKPFPIRHLEKLPGGWGIMADDWLAGIYAAILLRLALHFNLL